jgi:hypothetical protein
LLHAALLHLSHLLHHLGIHAAVGTALATAHAVHHLLHHLRVLLHHLRIHATGHATALHLLLHHLEVLLHALPVLCHHRWAHVVRTASLGSLVLLSAEVGLVRSAASACTAKATAATSAAALLAEVATRLGTLDFDRLAVNGEGLGKGTLDSDIIVEGDEAETTGTASVLVHHEGAVEHVAELRKELAEVGLGGFLAHTTDEDLGGLLLLVTWDGALGVDLC